MTKRFLIVLAATLLIFAVPAVYADEPGDSNSVGSGEGDPWGEGSSNPNPPKLSHDDPLYDNDQGDTSDLVNTCMNIIMRFEFNNIFKIYLFILDYNLKN